MDSKNKVLYTIAGVVAVAGILMLIAGQMRGSGGSRSESPIAEAARSATGSSGDSATVAAGNKAANFKLEALDGGTVTLEQLRGKVVWPPGGPCRRNALVEPYDELRAIMTSCWR